MLNNEEALLFRSIHEPIRTGLSWNELWLGPDNGLIWCWERGRQYRIESPEDATRAENGELVPIWWRGGVQKALKSGKIRTDGTLQYYATWLGLRNEDLVVNMRGTHTVICTQTGQAVQYLPFSQWREQLPEEQESAETTQETDQRTNSTDSPTVPEHRVDDEGAKSTSEATYADETMP